MEDAISMQKDAVDLIPNGHPHKPGYLNILGDSFRTCFERLGRLSDMEDAIFLYLCAASDYFGPTPVRFHASQKWISCARHIRHHSLLHAYSVAINLLSQLAWSGLSLRHRFLNSCEVPMWCGKRQLQLLNWGSQKLRSNGLSEDARPFGGGSSTFTALIKSCDLLIQIMPVDFGNYLPR